MDRESAFWWVNHKQTYRAEVEGGYIWSPKRKSDGGFNQTYENLTLVSPGDLVFSYAHTLIKAVGVVTGRALESGKPEEFGATVGENWSETEGWLVPVEWVLLPTPVKPKEHIADIAPLLPLSHSPIRPDGNGNQSCYLAAISPELGLHLISILGFDRSDVEEEIADIRQVLRCAKVEEEIASSTFYQSTEKAQLIMSRKGQGLFRKNVIRIEGACRVTGVTDQRFLIASHIKPWSECTDSERLDGENGLLLAPHIDKLFDRGWITFTDDGELLVAERAKSILEAWGIPFPFNVGVFDPRKAKYLDYHRRELFSKLRT